MNGKWMGRLMALPLLVLMLAAAPAHGGAGRGADFAATDEKTAAFFRQEFGYYLSSALTDTISEFRIVSISTSGNEKIPAHFDDFHFEVLRSSKGMETLIGEAVFYANGNEIKKMNVSAKVEIEAEVVVAAERISRGAVITEEKVRMEKVRIQGPVADLCTDLAIVVGQIADRNMTAGRPVAKSQLAKAMDVRSGDLVLIIAENSAVKLTTRGVAKKDGSIGDLIPVINLRSNKRLFGRVVDPGTVQVSF